MGFPSQELFKAVFQSFGGSCGKRNGSKSQKDAAAGVQGTAAAGIGTKSQLALKLQQEERKTQRRTVSRRQREAEKQRLFDLKQQKRKEKHKGR